MVITLNFKIFEDHFVKMRFYFVFTNEYNREEVKIVNLAEQRARDRRIADSRPGGDN